MMLTFGFYEQVINQTIENYLRQLDDQMTQVITRKADAAESAKILAGYMAIIMREVLSYIEGDDEDVIQDRVQLCNLVIKQIADTIESGDCGFRNTTRMAELVRDYYINQDAVMLLALLDKGRLNTVSNRSGLPERPTTSIAENALFTGALHEPSMVSELKKEIATADRIDLLVSFIKWSGMRLIIEELESFVAKGGRLRVITTSYLGATDYKAVERLSKLPNTTIHISYDTERTRLHAKTYIFWRDTGFSTVYIGSSNISEAAMTSGLEWNIKLSQYDSHDILDKIRSTFNFYWNSPEFVPFDPILDSKRLRQALKSERGRAGEESDRFTFNFDITPYYCQQEILDRLKAEREVHSSYRNLIVAATGTGKTVIAALDYRNYVREHPGQPNRLLFVAHRKEILKQSWDCFRGVLKDYNFGSLLVGSSRPDNFDHLFVSIQSLNSKDLISIAPADYYDYIVIDEFHHAAANSYQDLLEHFKPRILLGLTATPERADGKNIFQYFDNRTAAEMRLGEAIERKLLSPFHYFGVTDSVDLKDVRWTARGYDESDLTNLYVFSRAVALNRVDNIIKAIDKYCGDRSELIGIGFCVSQEHARFMAERFNASGFPSEYLTADSPDELRDNVKKRLVSREISFVFVVDLYNEGVDIPEVNTVLFLRPTESLTVFLQQLGRGLRLCEGKEALTVLDFVGQARREFRFAERFQAMLPRTRRTVEEEIRHGFVNVPRGCSIMLERQAEEYILENIRGQVNNKRNLKLKLADFARVQPVFDAAEFFERFNVSPLDAYRTRYTLSSLAADAYGLSDYTFPDERFEKRLADGFAKLSFANSRRFISFLLDILPLIKQSGGEKLEPLFEEERRMLLMLHYTIWNKGLDELEDNFSSVEAAIYEVLRNDYIFAELLSLLRYQYDRIEFVDKPLDLGFACPLDLHCAYTMDQILAALGKHTELRQYHFQAGVLYLSQHELDVFFITLNKSERDYSPSTMYHDYAVNESLFHWESQNATTEQSTTGQRYINSRNNGNKVVLFVREYKKVGQATAPYTCLGLAEYESHYGSAPISILWQMNDPMPGFMLKEAVKG